MLLPLLSVAIVIGLLEFRVEISTRSVLLLVSSGSALSGGSSSQLLQGSRDNVGGQSQELAQVFDALVGEVVVVVLPVEGLLYESLGLERSQQTHNLQVGDGQSLRVLGSVGILLDDDGALCKRNIVRDCNVAC